MNLRTLAYAITLIMVSFTKTNAQHTIQGKITGADGKIIQNAIVLLQNAKDSSTIKTERTDAKGAYKILVNSIENTFLKTEAVGYASQVKTLPVAEVNPVIDFALKADKTLSEITVTARKPLIEHRPDRTIFNVENSITAIGGDALEALKKTPGVLILNNQVTIAGKGSVAIMIDGRMQQVDGDELTQMLRTIPADNLSRIEVITTPPARYDAEGNTGIINLVTKKNKKDGLRGSATASCTQSEYTSPTSSINLNYRKEKLNLFGNANIGQWKWKYTNVNSSYFPGQEWDQNIWQKSVNEYARVQAGADYALTKDATLGVVYTHGFSDINNEEHIMSKSLHAANSIDSVIYGNGLERESYSNKQTANLNYEWRIDTSGKKLNIDADYFSQAIDKNRELDMSNKLADGSTTIYGSNTKTSGRPTIKIMSLKADVEWPTKIANFSFGGKASFVHNISDILYQTLQGTVYEVDTTRTNTFEYKEQIQALYFNAQKTLGKFELQAGIRGEHTQTDGYSPTLNQRTIKDYTKFFPSGYIQYQHNKDNVFNLSLSTRIGRPGYNSLNPFRYYISSQSYIQGNANLEPSFIKVLEGSYTLKSKYTLKLSARNVNNYSDRFAITDTTTGTTSFTRANIGKAWFYSAGVELYFNPTKWWELRTSINGEYYDYRLDYGTPVRYTGMNGWIEAGNSFFLNKKKTWSAEISGYYYSPRQKDYKRWDYMNTINIGIKAQFLDKNLIVAIDGEDLTAGAYWLQTNVINGTKEYSYDGARDVRLSVTYKFGNKNVKSKRNRSITTEEMQRVD